MTGTEKAALRLALGVLRLGILRREEPVSALLYACWENSRRTLGLGAGWVSYDMCDRGLVGPRILRARLALFLRVVLRAEAGDVGAWWVGELLDDSGAVAWFGIGRSQSRMAEWSSSSQQAVALWVNSGLATGRFAGSRVRLARPLWETGR